jgi:hypothetical protein
MNLPQVNDKLYHIEIVPTSQQLVLLFIASDCDFGIFKLFLARNVLDYNKFTIKTTPKPSNANQCKIPAYQLRIYV